MHYSYYQSNAKTFTVLLICLSQFETHRIVPSGANIWARWCVPNNSLGDTVSVSELSHTHGQLIDNAARQRRRDQQKQIYPVDEWWEWQRGNDTSLGMGVMEKNFNYPFTRSCRFCAHLRQSKGKRKKRKTNVWVCGEKILIVEKTIILTLTNFLNRILLVWTRVRGEKNKKCPEWRGERESRKSGEQKGLGVEFNKVGHEHDTKNKHGD